MTRHLSRALIATILLLASAGPVVAADPVESAALDYVAQMKAAWANDPAEAANFGFSSVSELDAARVVAVYPVHALMDGFYGTSAPHSIVGWTKDTDLSWVVIGVDSLPKAVVSVQKTADGKASAVGMGWAPADQLVTAMAATGNAGEVVWIPDFVSVVVDHETGGVMARPLLTDMAAQNLRWRKGGAIQESVFAGQLYADRVVVGPPDASDRAAQAAGVGGTLGPPDIPGPVLLVLLLGGLLVAGAATVSFIRRRVSRT